MPHTPHLLPYLQAERLEAGCDEAGRGPLAGPVYAAAVILPEDFHHPLLNDSKQMSEKARNELREVIEREAVAWKVEAVQAEEIDRLNILWASVTGMQRAVLGLSVKPEFLLIDGNRFRPFAGYGGKDYRTVVHGDATYASIAAASVLAKTCRDERMRALAQEYPGYGWERNMGYPTPEHIEASAALATPPNTGSPSIPPLSNHPCFSPQVPGATIENCLLYLCLKINRMKRIFVAVFCFIMTLAARADEGMWLLPMLQKFNEEAMRNIGCRLTAEDIYNINHASLKDAIVQFGGGCTGEVISQQGLLSTNHHCGYGSIQRLSTPEKNYLEDGFFAKSLDEEIPVPGLTVKFMKSMEDVTDRLAELEGDAFQAKSAELEKAAAEANPNCTARVVSFYNNNVWYLIVYQTFKDIRFVGAPPVSMGKFGGETDNWMWPRHTCDFSLFRIYADADNNPADYSNDNKPYTPAKSLKISLKGVQEGDFTFIMGYPGRTQRFQTATQLEDMVEANNLRVEARTVRQKVMWDEMMADPVVRLQYANKYAGSANGWKKWQGEDLAFRKLNIIGREKHKEAELGKWIDRKKSRREAWGNAIGDIDKYIRTRKEGYQNALLLMETFGNIEILQKLLGSRGFREQDYNKEVDRKISKALVAFYLDKVKPENKIKIEGWDLSKENGDAFVDWLFEGENVEGAKAVQEALANNLDATMKEEGGEAYRKATRDFAAALLAWNKGKPSYPDANFTMRLTYGSVKPYSPKDGVSYWYWCTANGILEKENPDDYEFRVPEKVHDLIVNKDFGRWADKDGQLHTCFLSNNDITGGNSGSPVLDADGNLIGLAFDGNWESMSSDVMFEPDLQRCINVDIRYVLWMVEKWGEAHNIIKELEFAK